MAAFGSHRPCAGLPVPNPLTVTQVLEGEKLEEFLDRCKAPIELRDWMANGSSVERHVSRSGSMDALPPPSQR